MSQHTIHFDNLIYKVPQKKIVKGVSMVLNRGEIVGLFGPNGAGKTTTFLMMVGLNRPSSGTITLGAKNITDVPIYRRSALGLGYLSQETSIFQSISSLDNVMIALELSHPKKPKAALKKQAEDIIQELQLTEVIHTEGRFLSGGQKRRLEIARVMAQKPKLIFLDEPFAGVDPLSIHEMKSIINMLKHKNIGIMITDHNVRDTLPFCDRAYVMVSGRMIASGTPNEIIQDEQATKAYLGTTFK